MILGILLIIAAVALGCFVGRGLSFDFFPKNHFYTVSPTSAVSHSYCSPCFKINGKWVEFDGGMPEIRNGKTWLPPLKKVVHDGKTYEVLASLDIPDIS